MAEKKTVHRGRSQNTYFCFLIFPFSGLIRICGTDSESSVLLAVDVAPLSGLDAHSGRVPELHEEWLWSIGVRRQTVVVEMKKLAVLPCKLKEGRRWRKRKHYQDRVFDLVRAIWKLFFFFCPTICTPLFRQDQTLTRSRLQNTLKEKKKRGELSSNCLFQKYLKQLVYPLSQENSGGFSLEGLPLKCTAPLSALSTRMVS